MKEAPGKADTTSGIPFSPITAKMSVRQVGRGVSALLGQLETARASWIQIVVTLAA